MRKPDLKAIKQDDFEHLEEYIRELAEKHGDAAAIGFMRAYLVREMRDIKKEMNK